MVWGGCVKTGVNTEQAWASLSLFPWWSLLYWECPQASSFSFQIMCTPRGRDRFTTPSFIQRDPFSRFQPTYPYVQHEIDLPPTISLSDGEEPPPYQGPCTLQLRDPEQQMELNRESVRAPPNRTVFDSDLIDISMYNGGPCPPSSHSGISAATCSSNGRMEGPPPTYSEVMGHYPGTSFFHHQHSNAHRGSRPQFQPSNSEGTIVPIKGKDRKPGNLVWVPSERTLLGERNLGREREARWPPCHSVVRLYVVQLSKTKCANSLRFWFLSWELHANKTETIQTWIRFDHKQCSSWGQGWRWG